MKNRSFNFIAAFITLALSGVAASAAGCGGGVSTSSLCKDICTCEGCTSNDVTTCEAKGDKAAADADAAGCSSQFEDAVTCTSAHVSCKNNRASTDGCAAELAALSKCSSTLSVFGKNDCELAVDSLVAKLASCPVPPQTTTTSSTGGGQVECTAAAGNLIRCQAAAFAAASCDCIGGGDVNKCTAEQSKSFSDAFTACQ